LRLEEEEMLNRMTRLLEQGCTMLANHHSCGAPLFRCKGNVICPVCSFEVLEPDKAAEDKPSGAPPRETSPQVSPAREAGQDFIGAEEACEDLKLADLPRAEERLRASLLFKIKDLAGKIESEQDLERLQRELDCAASLLKVLELLKGKQA